MTGGWPSYYISDVGHYVHPIGYCKSTDIWIVVDPDRDIIKLSNNEFMAGINAINEASQIIVIRKVV
jgi:hypothetical protein